MIYHFQKHEVFYFYPIIFSNSQTNQGTFFLITPLSMKKEYTDIEIIQALQKGGREREFAWEYMYKTWRNYLVGFICNKGGTELEALEAIADVARPFEIRIIKPDFVPGRAQLRTYFSTCVLLRWLKVRKMNSSKKDLLSFEDEHVTAFAENVVDRMIQTELAMLLDRTLSQIGDRCKKILTLFMNKYSMKEIAAAMLFENEVTAKKEKYKCQTKYENYLAQHPVLEKKLKYLLYE